MKREGKDDGEFQRESSKDQQRDPRTPQVQWGQRGNGWAIWQKADADGGVGGKEGLCILPRYPHSRFPSPNPNDSHIVQTSAFLSSQPLHPIAHLTSAAGCFKGIWCSACPKPDTGCSFSSVFLSQYTPPSQFHISPKPKRHLQQSFTLTSLSPLNFQVFLQDTHFSPFLLPFSQPKLPLPITGTVPVTSQAAAGEGDEDISAPRKTTFSSLPRKLSWGHKTETCSMRGGHRDRKHCQPGPFKADLQALPSPAKMTVADTLQDRRGLPNPTALHDRDKPLLLGHWYLAFNLSSRTQQTAHAPRDPLHSPNSSSALQPQIWNRNPITVRKALQWRLSTDLRGKWQ